jgi:hypothetical protein
VPRRTEIGFADTEGDDVVAADDKFEEVPDAGAGEAAHVMRDAVLEGFHEKGR